MNDWRSAAKALCEVALPGPGIEPTGVDIACAYLREAIAALEAAEKRASASEGQADEIAKEYQELFDERKAQMQDLETRLADAEQGVEVWAKTAKAFEQDGLTWMRTAKAAEERAKIASIVACDKPNRDGTPKPCGKCDSCLFIQKASQ